MSPGHFPIRESEIFPLRKGQSGPFSIYSSLGSLQAESPHSLPEMVPFSWSNIPTGVFSPAPRRKGRYRTMALKPPEVSGAAHHYAYFPISWAGKPVWRGHPLPASPLNPEHPPRPGSSGGATSGMSRGLSMMEGLSGGGPEPYKGILVTSGVAQIGRASCRERV